MAFTTVFTASAILNGTDDGGADGLLNFRQRIAAAALSSANGTSCRVTFLWGSASTTDSIAMTAAWFGQAGSSSGNLYNFTGDQQELFWAGSSLGGSSPGGTIVSDAITLGETWDNTKDYVFSFSIRDHSAVSISISSFSNDALYNAVDNGSGALAGVTNPSTTTYTLIGNFVFGIQKIEINVSSAAAFISVFSSPWDASWRKVSVESY